MDQLPEELLIEVMFCVHLKRETNPRNPPLKAYAFVSKKFARCTQEVLLQDIDLTEHGVQGHRHPAKQRAVSLLQTLRTQMHLGRKVYKLRVPTYVTRKDGRKPREDDRQYFAQKFPYGDLYMIVDYLHLPHELQALWSQAIEMRHFVAVIAGLLSMMPNLRELVLVTNACRVPVLAALAQHPSRPILRSLKSLEVLGSTEGGHSIVQSRLFYHESQLEMSLFHLPSLQKLSIESNKTPHDIWPNQLWTPDPEDEVIHRDMFKNLRGVSNITDLHLEGNFCARLLTSFLRCFKVLKKLAIVSEADMNYRDHVSILNALLGHQTTLEYLAVRSKLLCFTFPTHPHLLRVLEDTEVL